MSSPDSLKVAKEITRPGAVFCLARWPGTMRVAVGGSDFKVYTADLEQAKPEFAEIGSHTSYVTGVSIAGDCVISGGYDGKLSWWDAEKRTQDRSVEAHSTWIRALFAMNQSLSVVTVFISAPLSKTPFRSLC